MRGRPLLLGALLALAACAGENTAPTSSNEMATASAKRYIVVLTQASAPTAVAAASVAASQGVTTEYVFQKVLPGFVATLDDQKLAALRNDPRVDYVEADQVVSIYITQSPTPSWGLDRIDQRNLPLNTSYTYNNTGAGVHFYSIDTGILPTHVDIAGRVGNGFTSIIDGNGTMDCNGHGTHTTTTAAGTTYGVAKGMTVHPVRVLDCAGFGTTAGVIAGIDWVTQNRVLPAVANMSLGGPVSAAENAAVAASVASGVVYSVSAGNSGANACNQSPASEPSAITVGATRINDARAAFSNTGTCLDIFAPGVNIVAGYIGSNTATATLSGTSMSAPHVAGVAGLYLEANPGSTPAQVTSAIITNSTANKVTNPGAGSPNRLLYMGFIGGGPGNLPPVASFTWSCTPARLCSFDGTGSSDPDGTITAYVWKLANGNTVSTASTFSRQFTATTSFALTLTVTDNAGATGSQTQTITVP